MAESNVNDGSKTLGIFIAAVGTVIFFVIPAVVAEMFFDLYRRGQFIIAAGAVVVLTIYVCFAMYMFYTALRAKSGGN